MLESPANRPSRPLRVLLVSPAFGSVGGVETFMSALVGAVVAHPAIEPRICLFRARTFRLRPEFERMIAESPVPVSLVDQRSPRLIGEIARSDLVHAQTMSPDVALAARLLRKPLVLTVHQRRTARGRLKTLLRLLATSGARARWYNSDFVWDSWEPAGRRPTSDKLPVLSDLPQGEVPPESRQGFVFAARWQENKGIETLVEAYAAARLDRARWPLVLLGDGPLRPRVEELIRRYGLDVEAPGFVEFAERNDRIRRAKWMVTPPHMKEDLGLTPLEARAVGVPCIATRDGGVPEAAGPFSLICAPGSVDELAMALEYAAGMSEEEYGRMSRATKALLLTRTRSLSVYAERYLAIAGRLDTGAAGSGSSGGRSGSFSRIPTNSHT